jgi:hypothetical protein
MKRSLLLLTLFAAACGGVNPVDPSRPDTSGPFAGGWSGPLTIIENGQTFTGLASVNLSALPGEAGSGYASNFHAQTPALAFDSTGHASTAWPNIPPTTFKLDLSYPAGACFGTFTAIGQAETTRRIVADVTGYALCSGEHYTGRLILDRQ